MKDVNVDKLSVGCSSDFLLLLFRLRHSLAVRGNVRFIRIHCHEYPDSSVFQLSHRWELSRWNKQLTDNNNNNKNDHIEWVMIAPQPLNEARKKASHSTEASLLGRTERWWEIFSHYSTRRRLREKRPHSVGLNCSIPAIGDNSANAQQTSDS